MIIKIKKIAFASMFSIAGMISLNASAEVITFEDRPTSQATIANGYHGFNWSNFVSMDSSSGDNSGYRNGDTSPTKIAFNAWGTPAALSRTTSFALNSAFFTAAWNDGLNMHVVGQTTGGDTLIKDFIIDTSNALQVVFDWSDLLSVTFTSFGGVDNPAFSGEGTHFALDDLIVNEPISTDIPEPASLALLGLGLLGFCVARRRKL